tara:strand:+ start:151 stop:258 length:108 start_codon:yes stop_codon:yes gene_type:complete
MKKICFGTCHIMVMQKVLEKKDKDIYMLIIFGTIL